MHRDDRWVGFWRMHFSREKFKHLFFTLVLFLRILCAHSSPLQWILPRDSIACFRLKKKGFSLGLKQICGRILPSLISTFFSLLCNASARFFQDKVRKKKINKI
jgi:hypothetical protein